jgi:hypothetical protein
MAAATARPAKQGIGLDWSGVEWSGKACAGDIITLGDDNDGNNDDDAG